MFLFKNRGEVYSMPFLMKTEGTMHGHLYTIQSLNLHTPQVCRITCLKNYLFLQSCTGIISESQN